MQQAEAISLIQKAINSDRPQRWADLGSGSGIFTLALNSILPPGSQITAVDKQPQKLPVDFIKADFEKDDLNLPGLDGILMANSLHYIREKQTLIKKLEVYFSASPTFLIVEYDTNNANPWVSFPLSFDSLKTLFTDLGYQSIAKLAERPSVFNRAKMYAALLKK